MKQSTVDNVKLNILAEKIREAVKDGTLEQKMSLFRMEASEIGLTSEDVNEIINDAKKVIENNEMTKAFMEKNKLLIYFILLILLVLEWFLPLSIGWKIALSLLTVVVAIIIISFIYLKKKQK